MTAWRLICVSDSVTLKTIWKKEGAGRESEAKNKSTGEDLKYNSQQKFRYISCKPAKWKV